jgi:hypothetical protein
MVGRAGAIQGFAYRDIPLGGFFLKPVEVLRKGRTEKCVSFLDLANRCGQNG